MRAAARRAARHLAQMGYDPVEEELAALERKVRAVVEESGQDFDAFRAAAAGTVAYAIPLTGEAEQCSWCGGWLDGWHLTTEPHVKRCDGHCDDDFWPEDDPE